MNRRRFLKYAGVTATVVGASAAAYYLYNTDFEQEPQLAIPTGTGTATSPRANHSPVAGFTYKPYFLNPTDEQTIQFDSRCYDADNDPLTYAWYVDGNRVGQENNYSTRLMPGDHVVKLEVSDGVAQDNVQQTLTVEPEQIYPAKALHVGYKGITYFAGNLTPGWPLYDDSRPSTEEMDQQLDTIRNELGCNAIIVSAGGDHEDKLVQCAKLAIVKGFDRVYVQPQYMGETVEETVGRIGEFANQARALRDISDRVVYNVGHEFCLETAIVEGKDWWERSQNLLVKGEGWDKVGKAIPRMFRHIIEACKRNYGYGITYSAAIPEQDHGLIPWSDPVFESVGVDAYMQDVIGWDENWVIQYLSRLRRYGKPVYSAEAGSMTFSGADELGAVIFQNEKGQFVWEVRPYDEDAQANYIKRYCDMLNTARIDGYFYTQYNYDFDKGYGLYHPTRKSRKKGFYMYKSYERS